MEKIFIGGNLEEVVKELLVYKKMGFSVCCDFNGHTLYSDNVTLDSAYLEVTGYTYRAFLEARKRQLEEWKSQEMAEKEAAKAKKPEWIERGHKLIPEDKWAEWERCIDIRIDDLYNGKEVEHALTVMEAHANGTPISEISKMIDSQNHSGMSYGVFKSIIEFFYTNGEQLLKELDEYEATKKAGSKKI